MEFTKWNASSMSICKYRSLEVDFSPTKSGMHQNKLWTSRAIFYGSMKPTIRINTERNWRCNQFPNTFKLISFMESFFLRIWQKSIFFTDFNRKVCFTILVEKCVFCSFGGKVCFTVLAEKSVLWFWQESAFLQFWRKNAFFFCFDGKVRLQLWWKVCFKSFG